MVLLGGVASGQDAAHDGRVSHLGPARGRYRRWCRSATTGGIKTNRSGGGVG